MSTRLGSLLGLPDDPREIELVRSLLEKTNQGKIPWARRGNAITATIPNGLEMNFVLSLSLLGSFTNWELFTVRDRQGNQLLRITNSGLIPILGVAAASPLVTATNELFRAVHGAAGDELDRAISAIKKL